MEGYDFGGWATRNDIRCSDGRTIRKNAFIDNDGKTVPLVWNHSHNDPANVLGHALLENRDQGVYAYCKFNNTELAQNAKELVKHGDVTELSIYANQLKQNGGDVLHGAIREVSLVLAGANPGAFIDSIMMHGEESDEEAIIYTGESISLSHADTSTNESKPVESKKEEKGGTMNKEKTMKDVLDELTEEQKNVVYALIGQALEDGGVDDEDEEDYEDEDEGDNEMKQNVFDNDEMYSENVLSHSDMMDIISDAKRYGSMKDSFLAHTQNYGIENVDFLFPEPEALSMEPAFVQRDMTWVQKVMAGVHHTPFSRIKSLFADITADEARAKGYIKGKMKKEEVFTLLKRTTTPTTIYKKQKMDRDDVVDITDFDVIAWLKKEMRLMLDEEIARAILIGDGRLSSSDDKINETNIRPILNDEDLYTVKANITVATSATGSEKAKAFIDTVIRSRKDYKGSGNPTLFTTEDMVTEC